MQFHYSKLILYFVLLIFLVRTLIIELFRSYKILLYIAITVFINADDFLQSRCGYPPSRLKIFHEPADNETGITPVPQEGNTLRQ